MHYLVQTVYKGYRQTTLAGNLTICLQVSSADNLLSERVNITAKILYHNSPLSSMHSICFKWITLKQEFHERRCQNCPEPKNARVKYRSRSN